jgi:AraC-like DNA-binding protein
MHKSLHWLLWLILGMQGISYPLRAADPVFRNDSLEQLMAQYQYREALTYVQVIQAQPGILSADQQMYYLTQQSNIHYKLIQYAQAIDDAQCALELFPLVRDSLRWAEASIALALANNSEGDLALSSSLAKQVLNFTKRHPNPELDRYALFLLGTISLQNNQFDQAMLRFRKAHRISQDHQLHQFIHVDYLGIGMSFMFAQQLDSALFYLLEGAELASNKNDQVVLAGIYATIANGYHLMQALPQWKEYLLKTIKIAEKTQHAALLIHAYSQLLDYEMSSGNVSLAIHHGLQVKAFLQTNPMPLSEVYVDSLLYTAYKRIGNTPLALQHFESYYHLKTAILNKEQAQQINQLSLDLDMQEKDLQLTQQELQLTKANKKLWLSVMGYVGLLAILMISLLLRWLRKRNNNRFYQKEKIIGQLFRHKDLNQHPTPNNIQGISMPEEDTPIPPDDMVEIFSEEHKELYDNMIRAIESQKLYLNPKLDKNLIITLLGTNRFYLFQALNKHADIPFRDIINRYRIEEAKRLIQQECSSGIVNFNPQLYADAGFNSSSTYYRTFKQQTGLSPMEYAKEYLKDLQA